MGGFGVSCADAAIGNSIRSARMEILSLMARKFYHKLSMQRRHFNWRNIAITLIDHDFGEQTAQSCANAC